MSKQFVSDVYFSGKIYADNISVDSSVVDALFQNGTEFKKRTLGSMAFEDAGDYLDSISVTIPTIFTPDTDTINTADPTLSFSLVSQTTNKVFAAPNGSTGTPTFRLLVANDIPTNLNTINVTGTGTFSGQLTASAGITSPHGISSERFGTSATASGAECVAFGVEAAANFTGAVSLGFRASVFGSGGISIGQDNDASGQSISIGSSAVAKLESVALGYLANAGSSSGVGAIAIGYSSLVSANYSVALGYDSTASHTYSVALGYQASTTAANQLMIGNSTQKLNVYIHGNISFQQTSGTTLTQSYYNGSTQIFNFETTTSSAMNIYSYDSGVAAYIFTLSYTGHLTLRQGLNATTGTFSSTLSSNTLTTTLGITVGRAIQLSGNPVSSSFFDYIQTAGYWSMGANSAATRLVLGGYRVGNWEGVDIYASGSKIFDVSSTGVTVTGTLTTSGVNTLSNLAGTGTEMVVANASGVLSRQAIPTFSNGITESSGAVKLGGPLTQDTDIILDPTEYLYITDAGYDNYIGIDGSFAGMLTTVVSGGSAGYYAYSEVNGTYAAIGAYDGANTGTRLQLQPSQFLLERTTNTNTGFRVVATNTLLSLKRQSGVGTYIGGLDIDTSGNISMPANVDIGDAVTDVHTTIGKKIHQTTTNAKGYVIGFTKVTTNTAASTELTTDGNAASGTTNRFVIEDDRTYLCEYEVVARATDDSWKVWTYRFVLDKITGSNATITGTDTIGTSFSGGTTTGWAVTIGVNTTNQTFDPQVTGTGTQTIRWHSRLKIIDVYNT